MNDAEIISAVIVGVVVAFYFMFARPASKEQARRKQQIRDLRPGDEVLTTSGFIARVKDIQIGEEGSTRILLELADGVVFTAMTMAILERLETRPGPAEAKEQRGLSA